MSLHGRISTEALEHAVDQLIRARITRSKASIKPRFVAAVLTELLDRRREEELILLEVEDLFGKDGELDSEYGLLDVPSDPGITIPEEPKLHLMVDEVMSLDDLGRSSWDSSKDIDEIDGIEEIDDDEFEPQIAQRSKRRSKHRQRLAASDTHRRAKWHQSTAGQVTVICMLLAIIALTFGPLLFL